MYFYHLMRMREGGEIGIEGGGWRVESGMRYQRWKMEVEVEGEIEGEVEVREEEKREKVVDGQCEESKVKSVSDTLYV